MTAALFGDTKYVIRNTFLKLLAVFLLTTCYLILTTSSAFAQSTPPTTTNYTPYSTQYTSPQSPHTASLAIHNFSHAISCILVGQSPIAPCLEYKMYKDAQGMVKSIPVLSNVNTNSGVLGMSMSLIGQVIGTPPIKSSEFIANLGEQFGVKEANAQVGGSGSGVLASIFRLWEVSRNIAYLVMILIFIVVGLMVMFRQKLNPQTVVSIQMALPGLVIGLVMITFSYFLAALISDLAFVGTNVVGYYFSLAQDSTVTPTQIPLIARTGHRQGNEENVLSIFARYTDILNSGNIGEALASIWDDLSNPTSQTTLLPGGLGRLDAAGALTALATMIAVQFALPVGSMFGGLGQLIIGGTGAALTLVNTTGTVAFSLALIAMIVLIYSMLKLLMRLISSFLTIVFLTIAAPFFFLAASLPGRQGLATTWMFNMLCNVLAFPAVFGIFYFVAFLLAGQRPIADPLFAISTSAPPLSSVTSFPLLGGLRLDFLNALVAFGALVASPSIPDLICKAVGKPSQLGGIAAGALAGGVASGQRYYGQATGGITGFANQTGRLTNDYGHVIEVTKGGGINFRRPNRPEETAAAGARPGQLTKLGAGLSGLPGAGLVGSAGSGLGNLAKKGVSAAKKRLPWT